jgi:hypothetical protein
MCIVMVGTTEDYEIAVRGFIGVMQIAKAS